MLVKLATKVELLPIRAVTVYNAPDFVSFMNVESESSYRITPITRKTDKGHNRTVAYSVEITIYVPHAAYAKFSDAETFTEGVDESDHLLTRLNELTAKAGGVDTHLLLGNGGWNPGSLTTGMTVKNATGGVTLDFGHLGFNYEIESVEFRPRFILHFNGVVRDIGFSGTDVTLPTPFVGG